ncbi:hypothetical protein NPIL_293531 [Nephila pilipes]|uniref:Uncharacterized protein n=1 Tax=Nephila pilipes TaxID=299642 RepID=A0A8X6TPT0_NEPPI|nr:hypothetical protein NPIL_293531 [Nephila pilipes]
MVIKTEESEDNNTALLNNSAKLHDEINDNVTSNEKEETKNAIESNSTASSVTEFSTKEDNPVAILTQNSEETNVKVDTTCTEVVIETTITPPEKVILTENETPKPRLPQKEISNVTEEVNVAQNTAKSETSIKNVMYQQKQMPVDVSFIYSCLPQNFEKINSCDTCLNSKMNYIFKFLEV